MNYENKKIKNIYAQKFKKHKVPLDEQYIPKINGYSCSGGFIIENGTDIIDDENKSYLVIKVYMEEDDN